jgi:cytochrome b subunit of formate dehydrogenase
METQKKLNEKNLNQKNSISGNDAFIKDDEIFLRMNLAERIQHFILIITFVILIVTGLPLIFYEIKFLEGIFSLQRSFYIRGILHRIAAVALILNLVWHLIYTLFTSRGWNNFKEIIPKFKDIKDAFDIFWHHVGLTRFLYRRGILKKFFTSHPYWLFEEPPKYGRYNFIEKFEYWAVGWGSVIMIISGFFMWKVELSLSLFPLWVHDIFIIVHGYEAILAFLAVIIWHMYNVHLNPEVFPMSKVWLNGKIIGKELRTLHPLEYQKILEERKKASEASQ